MEMRLDKQVEVDQNIEKELHDVITQVKSENLSLKKECKLINKEYSKIESENEQLRKQTDSAKGTSQRLEKYVYGKGLS